MPRRDRVVWWFDRTVVPAGAAAVIGAFVLIFTGSPLAGKALGIVALLVVYGLNYLLRRPRR